MQFVKKYKDNIGNFRSQEKAQTAIEQINEDLMHNTNWTIYLLTPISSEEIIVVYVVYDVKEYTDRHIRGGIKLLNEELKSGSGDKLPTDLLNKIISTTTQ